MKIRFIFETLIGIIGIPAILLFGPKGGTILTLIVLLPLIRKRKFDDEDKLLFRKANIYSLIPFCILLSLMFVFYNQQINGYNIRDICMWLAGSFFVLSHGIVELIFFKNKKW